MDLFELLFIALFVLFPILEQVLRRKKQPGPGEPDQEEVEPAEPQESRWEAEREQGRASDMVPDDLWAVLTGEQRPPTPTRDRADEAGEDWSDRYESPVLADPEPETGTDLDEKRRESTWWTVTEPEEETAEEPVSLEYEGPEAYSLETFAPEPEPAARPLRSWRDRGPEPAVRRRRRGSGGTGLRAALSTPEGLRRAFVLSEVLGRPKGLE